MITKEGMGTEVQRANKLAINCYLGLAICFVVAYVLEGVKGTYTIGHILTIDTLLLVPLISGMILYRFKPDSSHLRDIFSVGYGLFFCVAMLTENDAMHFAYVIPMLCLTTMFHDWKFTMRTAIGIIAIIITYSIKALSTGTANLGDVEIIFLCVFLSTIFLIFSSRLLEHSHKERLDEVKEQEEKEHSCVLKIQEITSMMVKKIDVLRESSQSMESQSMSTKSAVEEISTGTADVANNIQEQLKMSNLINAKTEAANSLSTGLKDQFVGTRELSADGYDKLIILDEMSEEFTGACDTVSIAMKELVGKIDAVQETLNLINSVTTQTSLLSLNASIEAARAGESGRGFAVVAEQIKNLAEETKLATADIEVIFNELYEQSGKATDTVQILEQINQKQTSHVSSARESFEAIKNDIDQASARIVEQVDHMENIKESNNEISTNIENMSAFTEELLANSEATKVLSQDTYSSVQGVNGMLEEILDEVEELRTVV